jgi:hypothetical protein
MVHGSPKRKPHLINEEICERTCSKFLVQFIEHRENALAVRDDVFAVGQTLAAQDMCDEIRDWSETHHACERATDHEAQTFESKQALASPDIVMDNEASTDGSDTSDV